ncbi:MAG: 7-cyano-7-deazaguanine synthase, partial [Patescibacteria group bacterium]
MTKKKKEKVIVAMSGGVDSSVSALLLKRAGFEAEGIYMKLSGANPQAESAARKAAKQLGIKFRVVN